MTYPDQYIIDEARLAAALARQASDRADGKGPRVTGTLEAVKTISALLGYVGVITAKRFFDEHKAEIMEDL